MCVHTGKHSSQFHPLSQQRWEEWCACTQCFSGPGGCAAMSYTFSFPMLFSTILVAFGLIQKLLILGQQSCTSRRDHEELLWCFHATSRHGNTREDTLRPNTQSFGWLPSSGVVKGLVNKSPSLGSGKSAVCCCFSRWIFWPWNEQHDRTGMVEIRLMMAGNSAH